MGQIIQLLQVRRTGQRERLGHLRQGRQRLVGIAPLGGDLNEAPLKRIARCCTALTEICSPLGGQHLPQGRGRTAAGPRTAGSVPSGRNGSTSPRRALCP
ncbi:hypothetical protein GCM10018966_060430 [Streptomyces yanii]